MGTLYHCFIHALRLHYLLLYHCRYEKTRKRVHSEKWKEGWSWLKFTGTETMECEWYRGMEDDPGVKFQWKSAKLETLKHREASVAHQTTVQHKAAQKVLPGSPPAEKIIQQLNEKTFNRYNIV